MRSQWITDWNPNDRTAWEHGGRSVARRNLVFSIFAEFLGFSVWQLFLAVLVQHPDTPFLAMLLAAATAGFGGGNFAISMSNISFFYPDREKGWALGLNAVGGHVGVVVVQFVGPAARRHARVS